MRIGIDGRSLAGAGRGVAHYAAGLLGALAAADPGLELRVLLPRGATLDGDLAARANVVAVRCRAPSRVLHGAGAVSGRPRLDRLVGAVDVVWLPAPAPVAVGRRTPFALTLHDLSFLERPTDFTAYERLWHRLARARSLARRAARVLADSSDTARRAQARFSLPSERVTVVGAGPGDPGPPAGPEQVAAVRAHHRLPERYLLFVGALEPRKGVDRLAAAHARARAGGLDAALALAGDGRLRRRLRGPGVHVLGRVGPADKAALYAGALAVVLPSWCEGYGYPPLEGYAHGTPAILSDLAALRETAGRGARYVVPGDVAGLAAALRELADDSALRKRLAASGAAALRARSWPACAERLRAALEAAAA
jgi:glycosyltransferase involved in cell wall biosynthesis